MSEPDPVEEWQHMYQKSSRGVYKTYFTRFEKFVGKSGADMLKEARKFSQKPETADHYSKKVFEFFKYLANDAKAWNKSKPLSQLTCRTACGVVQGFFQFHNVPLNMKKFRGKDARMRSPQPDSRKHQLVDREINALMRIVDARDKSILALGLAGQDEATISSLRIEQFTGKLGETQLEFVDAIRQKTNQPIKILLTTEVQSILVDYMISLKRREGFLFPGYRESHIRPVQCNEVFRKRCEQAGVQGNGRRLTFHCCRQWFSTQLRNRISDDIIDLLTGHKVRFAGAYLADDEVTLRELLTKAGVENLLRLREASPQNGVVKELEEQKAKLEEQAKTIKYLQEELEVYKADMDAVREKFPLTEEQRAFYKPFPPQKGPIKTRDVKIYEPKSETELLKDEVGKLRREVEAMKQPQREKTLQTEPKKRSVALDAVLKEGKAPPNVHDEIAELRKKLEALEKAQKS